MAPCGVQDSRVAVDSLCGAEFGLDRAVDLSDGDVVLLEDRGSLLVLFCKRASASCGVRAKARGDGLREVRGTCSGHTVSSGRDCQQGPSRNVSRLCWSAGFARLHSNPFAREMLTKSVKNPNAALNRPFARMELRNPARVEFALHVVLVAALARVVCGDLTFDTSRPPKARTCCHRPGEGSRIRTGQETARTDPGCKELDQGERAVSNKVVKGRLCEVDHVGSRHGGDGSEAGKEGGGAHLLCRVHAGCQYFPLSPSVHVQAYECGRGWSESKEEFAAARRSNAFVASIYSA